MKKQEGKFETQRIQISRAELIERMSRAFSADGLLEVIPGIVLGRFSRPTERVYSVFKPSFCIIAQGSKQVLLGNETLRYDPEHYLISTVALPVITNVVKATEIEPYLGFQLYLDPTIVASVMMESGIETKKSDSRVKAMDVNPIDAELLDAALKLVRLLDTPDKMKFLAPLIIREIIYRLLCGEQSARLSHLLTSEGYTHRISEAVNQLRENMDQPLRIKKIARDLGMSVSGFHYHFKSVTAMSPVQFQKQLRLQEARRLMLGEDLDVTRASFRVGYKDASYFSREYKKLFGAPPQRDIARLRSTLKM